jgi:pimeloyl-ACP methyl ester carboxylesterase
VQVMVGTDSPPFFGEAARWLADRLGVEVAALTGGHTPYLDHPVELAEEIRPFLRQVSQAEQSDLVRAGRSIQ